MQPGPESTRAAKLQQLPALILAHAGAPASPPELLPEASELDPEELLEDPDELLEPDEPDELPDDDPDELPEDPDEDPELLPDELPLGESSPEPPLVPLLLPPPPLLPPPSPKLPVPLFDEHATAAASTHTNVVPIATALIAGPPGWARSIVGPPAFVCVFRPSADSGYDRIR